ncbi:MAG TPA: hypothetical protein VK909_05480 [Anaerolineales bacterium]|nr:hypothetical protein [Anaerolineales bacterium]
MPQPLYYPEGIDGSVVIDLWRDGREILTECCACPALVPGLSCGLGLFFSGKFEFDLPNPTGNGEHKYYRKILAGKSKGATNGLVMQAYKWLTGKGEHEIFTLVGAFILSSSPIEL